MTWYAIYRIDNGRLRSQGSTPAEKTAAQLREEGLEQKKFGGGRPVNGWNAETKDYDIPPPPKRKEIVTVSKFLGGLTREQRKAMRAARANDEIVEDFLDMMQMSGVVDPNNEDTAEAIKRMKSLGVI